MREAGVGFDLGYSFDRHSEARVGYELVAVDASTRIGDPTLPELSGFVNTVRARYTYDGVDNPVIPTRGVRFSGELRRLFDSEATLDDYTTLNMFAAIHHPVRENDTVFLWFGCIITLGLYLLSVENVSFESMSFWIYLIIVNVLTGFYIVARRKQL